MPQVSPQLRLSSFPLDRFDGGLNLRDAPTEVAPNETGDCMNMTLDERGGAEVRLGLSRLTDIAPIPSDNYVTNTGFEVDATGWSAVGSATVARSTVQHQTGVASLLLTATGSGTDSKAAVSLSSEPLTQGTPYRASCWIYAEGTIVGKQCQIVLREQGGVQPSANLGSIHVTLLSGWNRYSTVTEPLAQADRTNIDLQIGGNSTTAWTSGEFIYIDQVFAGVVADVVALYYSTVADALVAYVSSHNALGKLYKSTDGGSTWSSFYTTLTQNGQGSFIDFKNRLVFVNTLDGVYSFPSDLSAPTHTSGGSANMEEVRGAAIAVWQNKLWVTGDIREDSTHSQARVWFSNAGNEQLWTVASAFVDIRDVDTKICTALGGGTGMDVTGKPALLVYKELSTYRINDSTTGAYTTLHTKGAGAASARAVTTNLGRICSINREGIWVTDGLQTPVRVSDKLQPLFSPAGLSFSAFDKASAGPYRDRVIFSVARAGSSTCNLVIEYHPELGWAVPHDMDIGPMAVYTKQTTKLMGVTAGGGHLYEMFTGGSDDGAAIAARYHSPWVPIGDGNEARLRYLRAWGRGNCAVQVRQDFATIGEVYDLDFAESFGFVWDVDAWDVGIWGEPALEGNADEALDQVCKYVALVFSNSTTTSAFKPPLLGDGSSPEVGNWAVYGASLDAVQLGT